MMLSLLDARRKIVAGEISAAELIAEQERELRGNPHAEGCVTHLFGAGPDLKDRDNSSLPLSGIGLAHKDMFCMQGRAPHCGTTAPVPMPKRNATVIRNLEAAGATTMAALSMAEFAAGITAENPNLPLPANPVDSAAAVGGSSSGSAVAVAAGLCFGSIGTDTAGSVRVPSATCGIVGLKPTNGALPTAGCFPLAPSLDTPGIIARSAIDVATLFAFSLGSRKCRRVFGNEPRLDSCEHLNLWTASIEQHLPHESKIAFCFTHPTDAFELAPDQRRSLENFRTGIGVVGDETGLAELPEMMRHAAITLHTEAAAIHGSRLRQSADALCDITRALVLPGLALPAAWYRMAQAAKAKMRARFLQEVLGRHDVLITPILPHGVPDWTHVLTTSPDFKPRELARLFGWTSFVNYLGIPAIVFPIGQDDRGRPVCVQAIARPWREASLLAFAHHARATNPIRH